MGGGRGEKKKPVSVSAVSIHCTNMQSGGTSRATPPSDGRVPRAFVHHPHPTPPPPPFFQREKEGSDARSIQMFLLFLSWTGGWAGSDAGPTQSELMQTHRGGIFGSPACSLSSRDGDCLQMASEESRETLG